MRLQVSKQPYHNCSDVILDRKLCRQQTFRLLLSKSAVKILFYLSDTNLDYIIIYENETLSNADKSSFYIYVLTFIDFDLTSVYINYDNPKILLQNNQLKLIQFFLEMFIFETYIMYMCYSYPISKFLGIYLECAFENFP